MRFSGPRRHVTGAYHYAKRSIWQKVARLPHMSLPCGQTIRHPWYEVCYILICVSFPRHIDAYMLALGKVLFEYMRWKPHFRSSPHVAICHLHPASLYIRPKNNRTHRAMRFTYFAQVLVCSLLSQQATAQIIILAGPSGHFNAIPTDALTPEQASAHPSTLYISSPRTDHPDSQACSTAIGTHGSPV